MGQSIYLVTLIGTALVLAAAFSSLIAFRFGAPLLLLFLGLGLAAGVDGLGIALVNLLAGLLLIAAGAHYWRARAEALLPLSVMPGLYCLVGASFLLCTVVILIESPIYRVRTPDNWAENLNALAALLGMAGIGAISLALHQSRLVRRLHVASNTDPLTGLANRRALFDRHGRAPLAPGTAVAIFDLDHFKAINDRHGHAVGDEVLRAFASVVDLHSGAIAMAARTGGEEFVLVMPATSAKAARRLAEGIRAAFAAGAVDTADGPIACTASAGISVAGPEGRSLDSVLLEADKALYKAKRGGRDRIAVHGLRVAA